MISLESLVDCGVEEHKFETDKNTSGGVEVGRSELSRLHFSSPLEARLASVSMTDSNLLSVALWVMEAPGFDKEGEIQIYI